MTTIDNNKIPVMRVTRAGDEVKLGVVAHDPHSPEKTSFVAISHVWVDGLGSTSEKGLPSCQVIRLAKSVASLTEGGDTQFWMDSLCIPEAQRQRKKAIGTMREVYQNAVAVLVIEKTIAKISKDAKPMDKFWAILSSSWAQRLWTYQEGYLAAKVFMLVADEQLIEMRPPFDEVLDIMRRHARTAAFHYLLEGMVALRPRDKAETDIDMGFAADALSWRTTSKATDETIAIAALFDIDSDRLISVEGSEARMRAFFLMVGRTPWDIIFHDTPRLSAPGFRWAPASLLARAREGFGRSSGDPEVLCTEDGLLGRYFVLCLSGDPRPLVQGLAAVCRADGGGEMTIGCVDDTNATPVAQLFNAIIFRSVQSEDKNPKQLPQQRFWWGRAVAVLLRDEVLREDHRSPSG
ncbi:hypothetical protein SLS58_009062 [Diplodia intermedia]|uniref:Heterokaryon incompatibility domain-containing protein n=1 Tax=Diplodia intermedia TaxID=856260 RepID=A0ABR3TF50_9PEZI